MNKITSYALGFLTVAATSYAIGVHQNTKKVSENPKLNQLEQEFTQTANEYHTTIPTFDEALNQETKFDYNGKLDSIVAARNRFGDDNGLASRVWTVNYNGVSTPTPLALNPFKWGNEINTSSLDNHFKEIGRKAISKEGKYRN